MLKAGNIYYVAANEPGASDANNGLSPSFRGGSDGPWLTIRHAAERMFSGDTAYVRAGVYYESGITFTRSGAPGAPITLSRYKSEEVILDGSKKSNELPGILIQEGQGYYTIQGFIIRNMPWSGIATDDTAKEPNQDITIRDCVLYENGWSGVDLNGVDGFRVENVEAYNNAYYGLNIGSAGDGAVSSAHGLIIRSFFHDQTGKEGHGIAVNQAHDIVIRDSIAYHNRIHGFDISDWPKGGELSHDIMLERNRSYDNGVAGFSINSDSHHVVFSQNIAWRNGADWAGKGSSSGFLCYEGCWHVEYYNNISAENSDAGFWVTGDFGRFSNPSDRLLIFKNNITFDNGRLEWKMRPALVIEGTAWEVIASHNNWGGPLGYRGEIVLLHVVGERGEMFTVDQLNNDAFQVGNVSLHPKFTNPALADWSLLPDSPMIDAGIDVGLPFCGLAPDMGAVEFCP